MIGEQQDQSMDAANGGDLGVDNTVVAHAAAMATGQSFITAAHATARAFEQAANIHGQLATLSLANMAEGVCQVDRIDTISDAVALATRMLGETRLLGRTRLERPRVHVKI
ncbi:hypothetical protein [Rhizobium paknamense]|uniref:Uncharacterized protein n=1 Tax=Rhizobium paknamense TaxID=1206817 RepID=A0ABU0IG39_9HYPH|nr:hypothetical protein [Rhizobium paknamense]MDQ0456216.1 hypothetical protein [Rhizobium paknamense]